MTPSPVNFAFTLAEVLIAVSLFSLLSTFCVFQSIGTFQHALQTLQSRNESLQREALVGKGLRYIVNTAP